MNNQPSSFRFNNWLAVARRHSRIISGSVFIAIVVACLCAGLWPFSAPANGVEWVPGQHAIRFVHYGTAFSRDVVKFPDPTARAFTIELLLKPRTPWTRGTPLAFYNREKGTSLEIQQVYSDLRIALVKDKSGPAPQAQTLEIADVFLTPEFLLTIASDGQQVSVFQNGKLLLTSSSLALSSTDLSGQVVLGNAPVRNHQWTGEVKGLAVYAQQLSGQTIQRDSERWSMDGAPNRTPLNNLVALYLFREHQGRVVHDSGLSRADLEIPTKYVTVDQIRFERPSSEARDANYKTDAVFNVYGFMPLGFIGAMFLGCFLTRGRAAVIVIAIGFVVSLTIEYGQSFLPTRYSGTTDLLTNTLGTALGVLVWHSVLWLGKKIWAGHAHAQPR